MSSPVKHEATGAPASQPVFTEEILEAIFLRLDAVEDLARTSAACTNFRRIVSARRFLHRFRCLHPPPILGVLDFYTPGAFYPAEPPHHSAPAARALAQQAADFTFSFLDTDDLWRVCDARDARVLLYQRFSITADLMVCDPLHRRYVQLPAIPDDLAAATRGSRKPQKFDPFLDPENDEDKEKHDLSFRVICAVHCVDKLVIFHFSSVTGQWQGITFNRPVPLNSIWHPELFERYYAHGCYFWTFAVHCRSMVMLNMHDMEFSVVDLPPGIYAPRQQATVEAGEGMIGLFIVSGDKLQLYYKSLQGTEWHHERIIPLPKLNSNWSILDAATGYLLLQAISWDSSEDAIWEAQYFTLNLKTFLVERLCVSNRYLTSPHLYASFLSPFSLPSI